MTDQAKTLTEADDPALDPQDEHVGEPEEAGNDGESAADSDEAAGAETTAADAEEAELEAEEQKRGPGPGEELSDEELVQRTCALLFAAAEPLPIARLVKSLERPRKARVLAALEALGERLESSALPLRVRGISGGYMLMTAPEFTETIARLSKTNAVEKVSPAALETLAVIAYRQPVTKAEIEAIRGVQAGPIVRALVDRGLVRVTGRAEVPGHPLQYGTTREFLDRFGLMDLGDLPRDTELARD